MEDHAGDSLEQQMAALYNNIQHFFFFAIGHISRLGSLFQNFTHAVSTTLVYLG